MPLLPRAAIFLTEVGPCYAISMALTRCPQLIPLGPSEPWPARPRPLLVRNAGPGQLAVFPLPLAPQWLVAVPLDRERLDLAVEAVPRCPPVLGALDRQDLPVEGAVHPNPGSGEREEVLEPGGDRTHASGLADERFNMAPGLDRPGPSRHGLLTIPPFLERGDGRLRGHRPLGYLPGAWPRGAPGGPPWQATARGRRRWAWGRWLGCGLHWRVSLSVWASLRSLGCRPSFMPAPLGVGLHVACRPPTPIRHAFPRRLSSQTVAHSLDSGKNFRDRWTQGPVALATGANRSPENAGPRSGIADLFGIA